VAGFAGAATLTAAGAVAAVAGLGLGPMSLVGAAVVAVAGGAVAARLLVVHHPHLRLGLANLVTIVRLGLVAVLVGLLVAGDPRPYVVIGIAVVALSLDGVDGRLARRQGLASRFGAGFDMEVDSLFGLVLAALAASGPAGPLALLLGLPRYVFGAAAAVAPWLDGPLPERFSRKVVCVVQLIALIVLQLPWLPVWSAVGLTIVAAALVAWSFALDIAHLRRVRP
jgi:phosphatidylglycerophosphate synthase